MGDSLNLGVYRQSTPKSVLSEDRVRATPAGAPRAQLAFLLSPEYTPDPLSLKPIEWFSHGHGFLPELS